MIESARRKIISIQLYHHFSKRAVFFISGSGEFSYFLNMTVLGSAFSSSRNMRGHLIFVENI
jgi:hypothetical protein